jgi:hypothetical protein
LPVNADHGRMHWRWVKDGLAAGAVADTPTDPT